MSGDVCSFQNCCGAENVPGGFDSHTPPPTSQLYRTLPSVSELLESEGGQTLCAKYGPGSFKFLVREMLDELRKNIHSGALTREISLVEILSEIETRLLRLNSSDGRSAINATGILLHTGLGRSPLAADAYAAISPSQGYSILQTDLDSGKRSLREEKIEAILKELTGCEAATVVNNNAAATMLILSTLANNKEVIISRSQLVEIGGSFRMPDVMKAGNAILHEVGTTNRTHLRDYKNAINANTGALMHAHSSNYRIRGFYKIPSMLELCQLGKEHNLPVIDDIGSGALVRLSDFGIEDEPLIADSIAAGTDAVCFSGDKLICGPQSGIICGKKEIITRIRKNPFARMFRVCKITLAALETTLLHFLNDTYKEQLPFYNMLTISQTQLQERANNLLDCLDKKISSLAKISEEVSFVGSGSAPDEGIPTITVEIDPNRGAERIARELRLATPSVFCRIKDDRIIFDMRTLFEGQEKIIANHLNKLSF